MISACTVHNAHALLLSSSVCSNCLSGSVQLEVRLMPATNKFEVSENGNLAVSGKTSIDFMSHLQTHSHCTMNT